jgi:hypothetical protein
MWGMSDDSGSFIAPNFEKAPATLQVSRPKKSAFCQNGYRLGRARRPEHNS